MSKTVWTQEQLEADFAEMLDECYERIVIGTLNFSPSQVLKSVDPIAYRIAVSEHYDYVAEQGIEVEGF
jgi:hypothetical protein